MSVFSYLKFKLGYWVEVKTLPEWVSNAHDGYYEGFMQKYNRRPRNVEKVYRGDSLEYKIEYVYELPAPPGIGIHYYVRK